MYSANMADMDSETTTHTAPMAEEEEPLFSNLDLFLFSLIVGLVVYWFMSRKKTEPIPEFKKLDVPWVSIRVHLGNFFSCCVFLCLFKKFFVV